ncbi:beta-ketoacyl synthase N-terminal-like domain-containing protein [Bacillus sp. DX3.1]|uniref:beta-ketoacyl synthase N-terminal-like domain-containing protein n=1 Tax=Bacillus sp. DX3.1 TaxID=3052091 RepID=UPI00256FEF39|nr:beta-ketoacyl synthase N-terminal-like domain-containing protein [Bacillus sp. DX3.1]WJE84549.1 beta-ketoacyl synthase N-terminal-like domain-containing protein [Bacillus sp. DX3.1]
MREHKGRVAISGIGLVSPYGSGYETFVEGLFEGRNVIRQISNFDTSHLRNTQGGQVPDNLIDKKSRRTRAEQLLALALQEALLGAKLNYEQIEKKRITAFLSAIIGDSNAQVDLGMRGNEWLQDLSPLIREIYPQINSTVKVTAACATVGKGVSLAHSLIMNGQADIALICGSDVLNTYDYSSLSILRAITKEIALPFDVKRNGIIIGEGAGTIVLESEKSVRARGHEPLGWLEGCAFRIGRSGKNMVDLDLESIADCIAAALQHSKVEKIDYVHAHATGTKQGDTVECQAILQTLPNATSVPVSSHKGAVGHLLRCSGFLGIAAGLGALERQEVPPTVGLIEPDPKCNVKHVVLNKQKVDVQTVLMNSWGFCGNYTSLVISHPSLYPYIRTE